LYDKNIIKAIRLVGAKDSCAVHQSWYQTWGLAQVEACVDCFRLVEGFGMV